MVVDRQHEIIEIDKMEDLADSYFVRRGIIYSRDCDNNRLNVWIEGTLFENLEIFYHCENEIESTPDKAFDLFEVGRKVLVLHKIIYQEEDSERIEKIERTVIGLKYNSPEGINNLQPCVVKRFFVKVKIVAGESTLLYYYWVCIDDEGNITTLKINDNEDRTETEVFYRIGFFSELEKVLYLGNPLMNPLTQSATKSFMMTNDKDFRERWVATPCSLFKDQCEIINIQLTPPPPCGVVDLPCPPNRFYCDIEKRILVWYGSYSTALTNILFIGAFIVKFNTDTNYTSKSVAASGNSVDLGGAGGYRTLADTEWDVPLNMVPDVKEVDDTAISFYLPSGNNWRPGFVKIDWMNYIWGHTINSGPADITKHWYWSENGFEQQNCAEFEQTDFDGMADVDDMYDNPWICDQWGLTQTECELCMALGLQQNKGRYILNVITYNGYNSLYSINIFDDEYKADTTFRNLHLDERKHYTALIRDWHDSYCYSNGTYGIHSACRTLSESLNQKDAEGLSASWNSNNVAYFFKEKNRDHCIGSASQIGKFTDNINSCAFDTVYGGPDIADFYNCKWLTVGGHIPAGSCPDGIGKCFEQDMPGGDWFAVDSEYVETLAGPQYVWHRDTDYSIYEEPIVRKFKIDEEIEFDATEIYKTYYLDDRATCHEQGLIVAGKGVRDSEIFWEIYHDGIDITEKLFEALSCEQSELDEIGLI